MSNGLEIAPGGAIDVNNNIGGIVIPGGNTSGGGIIDIPPVNIKVEDEGVKAPHQIQGVTEDGVLKNIRVNSEGKLLVDLSGLTNSQEQEHTVAANTMTLNTEEQSIQIEEDITKISIANFSETANIIATVETKEFVIGPGIVVDLRLNIAAGSSITVRSTEENVLMQYILERKV